MKKENYKGWRNKETWSASLWLDEDYYKLIMDKIKKLIKENGDDEESIINMLADWLQDIIENNNPLEGENNIYSELLLYSLNKIDWYEIAKSYLEE